jgi:hypothetical protein
MARGLLLGSADEVLLTEGEFPATVFPWLPLRDRGVRVRLMRPEGESLTADELEAAIAPATRVLCLSWVFSYSARPIDVSAGFVDALVGCGFKSLGQESDPIFRTLQEVQARRTSLGVRFAAARFIPDGGLTRSSTHRRVGPALKIGGSQATRSEA